MDFDKEYLKQTLVTLVQINSVNPSLVNMSPGEGEIGHFISQQLKTIGIEVMMDEVSPGRFNVIGFIPGSGGGDSLMINAHMDTVGVEGMDEPFSGRIENGKLYGRGAQDMKGSIAAMISLAKTIKDNNIQLKGDLYFSFVVDEEYASLGTEDVVKKYKTDAAIVTEPTDLDVCIAHRGFGNFEIKTFGKAAHGGSPQDGIDANMHMGYVLAELSGLSQELQRAQNHPLLGQASLHIPLIQGGQQLFIYANECTLQYERRTLPGETEKTVAAEIQNILQKLEARHTDFRYQLNKVVYRDAFEIAPDKPIVELTKNAVTKVLGSATNLIGHGWWEDSALFAQNGSDTVIIGPKGYGIHSKVEWVDLKSVEDLSHILLETATNYCGI